MNRGIRFGFDGDDSGKWPDGFSGVSAGPTNSLRRSKACEVGIVNYAEGSQIGQAGVYNQAVNSYSAQGGVWNHTERSRHTVNHRKPARALQVGGLNTSAGIDQKNIQIGAYNGAFEDSDAIQLGLICYAGEGLGNVYQLGLLTVRSRGGIFTLIPFLGWSPFIGWRQL